MKQRLFVALDISAAVRSTLTRLQPPAHSRLRPIPADQLHMTLHFIGLSEPAAVAAHLDTLASPAFTLGFTGTGIFRSRGSATLWLGLEKNPALMDLYRKIGEALHPLAISDDNRRFVPHVTLARCRRGCPRPLIDGFLEQPLPALPELAVNHFSLHASELTPEGPVYSLLQEFTLNSEC